MLGLRRGLISLSALAMLGAGGCSFFPVSGPTSADIESGASPTVPYALVKLAPETIDILAAHEPKGLAGAFTDRRPPANITFGIGDVVSVTVFEAAAGGLFIPLEAGVRPGNFVNASGPNGRQQRQYHHTVRRTDQSCRPRPTSKFKTISSRRSRTARSNPKSS